MTFKKPIHAYSQRLFSSQTWQGSDATSALVDFCLFITKPPAQASKSECNVVNLDHVNMPRGLLSKIQPDDRVTSPSILFTRGKRGDLGWQSITFTISPPSRMGLWSHAQHGRSCTVPTACSDINASLLGRG